MRSKKEYVFIDELIKNFWENGYLTVSRKYGKYLPDPPLIGKYNVAAIGRSNKKYAIGIVIGREDLINGSIETKIKFLASRKTKYTHLQVKLFVGVEKENLDAVKKIVSNLDADLKKRIKLVILNQVPQASLFDKPAKTIFN